MPAAPQLVSYIALGAPATRRPATGTEPFLRPEFGFTPAWYQQHLDVDFGECWHIDPAYRLRTLVAMAAAVRRRFPAIDVASQGQADAPTDLLTGAFGACVVAAIYGHEIIYSPDNWPCTGHDYLTPAEIDALTPPDLDVNPFFATLMRQVDWIASELGTIRGYINWQGILNNAYRLRGEELLVDMLVEPERAQHLFACVYQTMVDAARRLHTRQRASGFDVRHFTVSNCLVNMVSPTQYRKLLLPFDQQLAGEFGYLGIHNCAWTADAYLADYARVSSVGYIDMGIRSDLARARILFPTARRALMYTPMDLANKSRNEIGADLSRIAEEYGPCDVIFADVEAGTPDLRVLEAADACIRISAEYGE